MKNASPTLLVSFALGFLFSLLSGCSSYGTGEHIGYVFSVDDGIYWDNVWLETTPGSPGQDCYLIDDENTDLKEALSSLSGERVRLHYDRYPWKDSVCGSDVVTSYDLVPEPKKN